MFENNLGTAYEACCMHLCASRTCAVRQVRRFYIFLYLRFFLEIVYVCTLNSQVTILGSVLLHLALDRIYYIVAFAH